MHGSNGADHPGLNVTVSWVRKYVLLKGSDGPRQSTLLSQLRGKSSVKMLRTIVLAASLLVALALADLETVTSSGRDRTYWVHEPDDFEDGQTYPAIIAFHGSSGIGFNIDGFAMEADVRLSLPVIPTAYSSDVSIFISLKYDRNMQLIIR